MSIPVYRHNLDYDDWEVASVYDSDDCDSLGGSTDDESSHSSGSFDDSALRLQGLLHDDVRRRVEYPVPQLQLQQQHQTYPPTTVTHPRWDARYVPGKGSNFAPSPAPIVPPPGVIFPHKDWVHSPQDTYWHPPTSQMRSISDRPADAGLDLVEPSTPSLLFAPSSPPLTSSALIRRPSPTAIAHGQPHPTSVAVPGTGTGSNVSIHASPIVPPPPRYHEVAYTISPRLAEAGCQAHSGMTMSPPRRSGHDVLSPYAPAVGHATMPRRPQSSEEIAMPVAVADGRYGSSVAGGHHPSHSSGDRPDLVYAPPVPRKDEHAYEHVSERDADGGRTRRARPQTRERRPSIWQRFVRRFSPSRVSIGQT